MLVRLAIRVRSAGYVIARVHATASDAGEDVIAVVVGGALVLSHGNSGATSPVRIADCSLRTLADVVALGVDAVGTVPAGVVRALVHVHAAVLGVSFVASLAHAPWWIAWRALRVDAAREPIAGVCGSYKRPNPCDETLRFDSSTKVFDNDTHSCKGSHREDHCKTAGDRHIPQAARISR